MKPCRKKNAGLQAALGLAGLLFCAASLRAETPPVMHTIWVTVESDPLGASVFGLDEQGLPGSTPLGQTPCILAVDLNWGSRWFKKRWEMITVFSPGGFCRPHMQPDGTLQLTARLMISKEGWPAMPAESLVATLKDPGKDWAGMQQWPTRHRMAVALTPEGGRAGSFIRPGSGLRRVVLAGNDKTGEPVNTGRVRVFSRQAQSEVFVDGQAVGPAPVELLLHSGKHSIEVRAPGHPPSRREMELKPDAELSFEAAFAP